MTAPRDAEQTTQAGGDPLPAEADTGSKDGLLDSLGKAITAPVRGAAEEDEPSSDGNTPPVPPG